MGPRWWTSQLPLHLEPQYTLTVIHQQAKWHTHRHHDSSKADHKDQKLGGWASLVVQWLRICLPMKGTQVRAVVQEDPTCRVATKPVRHNYWACALEPASHNYWARALEPASHHYWAHVPQLLKPTRLEPVLHSKRSHRVRRPRTATKSSPCSPQLEKARTQQRRPNTAKNK